MEIPNKRKKIAFNHSSDIDLHDFMNLYTAKSYFYC